MRNIRTARASALFLAFVFGSLSGRSAKAQVYDVVVGVTPSCPYGLSACWGGAYEALGQLPGVESVAMHPDYYNCTAHVQCKVDSFSNLAKWPAAFKQTVGELYQFRGCEVTLEGAATLGDEESLALTVPGIAEPVKIKPLRHKLQWNFRKGKARQPEEDERNALADLACQVRKAPGQRLQVRLTGPLLAPGDQPPAIEAREFFVMHDAN